MGTTEIIEILQGWNGKDNQPLKEFYGSIDMESVIGTLLQIGSDRLDLRPQITWLIKHHLENHGDVKSSQMEHLIMKILPGSDWATQLHIFQVLGHFDDPNNEILAIIRAEAERGVRGKNKFLRAWSYQALFYVSSFEESFREELRFLCERAILDESPSVKVRLREILRSMEKAG